MMEWLSKTARWTLIVGVLAVGSLSGGCRTSEVVFSDVPGTASTADARVFQVGDLVTINSAPMQNAPAPHEERIKKDGTISLPVVGSIVAAGKTVGDLQKEVSEKYIKAGWHPTVPYRPRDLSYEISGEVKQPGLKAYLGETRVTQAIQGAGGFAPTANKKKVKLVHPDGKIEIVNLSNVSNDPGVDRLVYPGERIVVPRSVGFGF